MRLDSDVQNPTENLKVKFYTYEKEPYKDVPFVLITMGGDQTNVIDQPARADHKARFPREWLEYQAGTSEGDIIGTPLLTWHKERPDEFPDGHLQELMVLKFQTVEQFASASDTQIMRIMGGVGLRARARLYLSGKNAKIGGEELQTAKNEIAELKAMMQQLLAAKAEAPAPATKRRGPQKGWKRNTKADKIQAAIIEEALTDVQHDNAATGPAGRE